MLKLILGGLLKRFYRRKKIQEVYFEPRFESSSRERSLELVERRSREGYTLVELLIAIFIFSVVILLANLSLVTGFASGRLRSSSTKEIDRDLNLTMDIISQKMANANEIGTLHDGTKIYGFKDTGNVPGIVSTSSSGLQCTFFGKPSSENFIYMKQDLCSNFTKYPSASDLVTLRGSKINSGVTQITGFSGSDYMAYGDLTTPNPSNKIVPYITIKIMGKDTRTSTESTIQNSYSLNYDTIKRIKPL